MRLGLDFDGTIANWGGAMAAWMAERAGRPFDPERNVVEQISREELQAMVAAILGSELTFAMEPQEEALAVMQRLAGEHELTVITARHDHEAVYAAQWLARHGAPIQDVVSTGRVAKYDTCHELGVDLLLDDSADHLLRLCDSAIVPVLFRGRFSPRTPQPAAIHVVEHWLRFEALCAELAARRRPPGELPPAP